MRCQSGLAMTANVAAVAAAGQPLVDVETSLTSTERLQSISRHVIGRRILRRDLVIPGSCLQQSHVALSSDLYQQSQLLDTRSRGQVAIFTLSPNPPHMCVLDFSDNLIDASIDRGFRAARGEVLQGESVVQGPPRFRKELGEPVFFELRAEAGD